MENLSELQNPLLDKNSKHMVNGYGGDFSNNQYQENIINYFAGGGGGGGGGEGGGGGGAKVNNGNVVSGGCYNGKMKSQQLLDATSLHLAVEAFYRPNFILYKEDGGSIKAKEYKSECCETTFTEKKSKEGSNTAGADAPAAEDPQAKLLEDGEHVKIQTVSYEVEEEEYVEYEVSAVSGEPPVSASLSCEETAGKCSRLVKIFKVCVWQACWRFEQKSPIELESLKWGKMSWYIPQSSIVFLFVDKLPASVALDQWRGM